MDIQGIGNGLPAGSLIQGGIPGNLTAAAQDPDSAAAVSTEFESVFLAMLLKTMRTTVSEDGMFAGDRSDTFGSMFDLFMSQHLAGSDSLGIGQLLEQSLTNSPRAESPAEMP